MINQFVKESCKHFELDYDIHNESEKKLYIIGRWTITKICYYSELYSSIENRLSSISYVMYRV